MVLQVSEFPEESLEGQPQVSDTLVTTKEDFFVALLNIAWENHDGSEITLDTMCNVDLVLQPKASN